ARRYTTKVTVAADAAADYAPIFAISPVSGAYNSCPAVFVAGPPPQYALTGDNGWTVTVTPMTKGFDVGQQEASLQYQLAFTKGGESTPFKKMSGRLLLRFDQETGQEISLPLEALADDGSPDAELAAITKKASDPNYMKNLPPKELDRLIKRMTELNEQKMKIVSAPDYAEKMAKEGAEFGCTSLSLTTKGDRVTGRLTCGSGGGQNGYVTLTGTSARAS